MIWKGPRWLHSKCRYFLLICFVVGMKICTITLLFKIFPHDLAKNPLKGLIAQTQGDSPGDNYFFTLGHLENASISPTGKNRTGSGSIWLIYNSVPWCRNEMLVQLLSQMADKNHFTHLSHRHQTNWNRFIKEEPIYVNFVSDPVTRFMESLKVKNLNQRSTHYNRSMSESLELLQNFGRCVMGNESECSYKINCSLSVPFFCGQHPTCIIPNNVWALQRAKFTIEWHYAVVGVFQDFNDSLRVFEHYIPRFFSNATQIHKGAETLEGKVKTQFDPDQKIRNILQNSLPAEFEIYRFIRQRLKAQLDFMSKIKF